MTYLSTKTFTPENGLSCCFRQWKAKSHCNRLHGYALAVKLTFEADQLDQNNWVVDFGAFKPVKAWLETRFDHKLLVAEDDPQGPIQAGTTKYDLADIVMVPATGCEAFAELIYGYVEGWLRGNGYMPRVHLRSVEVSEHGANSATYERSR